MRHLNWERYFSVARVTEAQHPKIASVSIQQRNSPVFSVERASSTPSDATLLNGIAISLQPSLSAIDDTVITLNELGLVNVSEKGNSKKGLSHNEHGEKAACICSRSITRVGPHLRELDNRERREREGDDKIM